jgi:hypothetical protein
MASLGKKEKEKEKASVKELYTKSVRCLGLGIWVALWIHNYHTSNRETRRSYITLDGGSHSHGKNLFGHALG